MDLEQAQSPLIQILLLLLFALPVIFFLIVQQNTLKAVSPENRKMRPAQVWLQLIPFFGIVWQFIVVVRISDSIRNELLSRAREDSVLGVSEEQLNSTVSRRPTHDIGISFCALFICSLVPFIGAIAAMGGLVCWIIYWGQLARYKAIMERKYI